MSLGSNPAQQGKTGGSVSIAYGFAGVIIAALIILVLTRVFMGRISIEVGTA